jgi:hypothetical protein
VGQRPSLGALKRSKAAAAAAAPAAAPVEAVVAEVVEPSPAEPSAPTAPKAAVVAVDRDGLTEAWGDSILRGLPARAKALYSAGRFVSVDADGGAHFALPNAAHRDRCAEMTATVEGKLSEHFGTPVRLVLDVEGDATPSGGGGSSGSGDGGQGGSGGGGGSTGSAGTPGAGQATARAPAAKSGDARDYEPEDDYDPSAFAAPAPDPGDQAKEAEARLLQAFPGASEVAG